MTTVSLFLLSRVDADEVRRLRAFLAQFKTNKSKSERDDDCGYESSKHEFSKVVEIRICVLYSEMKRYA